jgi:hypothetical protein
MRRLVTSARALTGIWAVIIGFGTLLLSIQLTPVDKPVAAANAYQRGGGCPRSDSW